MPYSTYSGMRLKFRSEGARRAFAAKRIQSAFRSRRRARPRAVARAAPVIKRVVHSMEPYKYLNFLDSSTIGTAWFNLANISNVPFDTTNNSQSRACTKVLLKNLEIRGTMQPAAGDGTNFMRLALVRGRRSGALVSTDIGYHNPIPVNTDLYTQFNQKYVDVIWDKTYRLQEQAAGSIYPKSIFFEKHTSINKTLKFTERETTGADQPYNNTSYYLVCCSDSAIAPHPRIAVTCRISWKDLD